MLKHRKSKKNFNRALAFATAMAILVVASVSATIAFLVTGTDSIKNIFIPSQVKTEVRWSSGNTARIYNTGDTEIYVRAAIVVNWVKKGTDGSIHVYSESPAGCHPTNSPTEVLEKCDYTIIINNNNEKWFAKDYGDGEVIYYYRHPLKPYGSDSGYSTGNLVSSFELRDGVTAPEGYELAIEIVASGIQSTPRDNVKKQWGIAVGADGTLSPED